MVDANRLEPDVCCPTDGLPAALGWRPLNSDPEGAGWLVRGELDRDEYVRFLMMLYHVYE